MGFFDMFRMKGLKQAKDETKKDMQTFDEKLKRMEKDMEKEMEQKL